MSQASTQSPPLELLVRDAKGEYRLASGRRTLPAILPKTLAAFVYLPAWPAPRPNPWIR